jgi:site-specific DNA-methyltransferase (adenine-specific)
MTLRVFGGAREMVSNVICGDCLEVLPKLPRARTIFADPPDNLDLKYDGGVPDNRDDYLEWLASVVCTALLHGPDVFWMSHYYRHTLPLMVRLGHLVSGVGWDIRLFLWRFTFGQHQQRDCGNGYRPILRFSRPGMTWNTDAIRIQSARQEQGDPRADPRGRVPDDVWDFPRVCGNFRERRKWHPNQHPEMLIERIVRMSGGPVIDMFGGTFTVQRVCDRLDVACTSIEISSVYCEQHARELGGIPPVPTTK